MASYQTFVVPYDFSQHARAALYTAADLGKKLQANLHLVHVVHLPTFAYGYGAYAGGAPPAFDMREIREGAQNSLNEVAAAIQDFPGKVEAHVVDGVGVANALKEISEKLEADLLIMGTHGRTGLAHVFLGSVAERTLRDAPCPVLTVRAESEEESSE